MIICRRASNIVDFPRASARIEMISVLLCPRSRIDHGFLGWRITQNSVAEELILPIQPCQSSFQASLGNTFEEKSCAWETNRPRPSKRFLSQLVELAKQVVSIIYQ